MATTATLPTLSTDGWVDSSLKTADYLFSHFFASDYSQSYTFIGSVSSFAHILHVNQGSISSTIRELQSSLSDYFGKYFTNVVVEIDDTATVEGSSSVTLNLFLNFTDKTGTTYSLGKMIEYTNTTINRIITLNNGS